MIMTYTTHRLELMMMVASGPLLVTVMASYIHLILLLRESSCPRQDIYCNIHGPERTTLILKYVQYFLGQPRTLSFHSSHRRPTDLFHLLFGCPMGVSA